MRKKISIVLYNILKICLLCILFNCALFFCFARFIGSSRPDYTSVFLVLSFFSLVGTYIPKIERISSIIFFISVCLFFLLRLVGIE